MSDVGVVVANPDTAEGMLEGMTGTLNILDRTGHSRMQWNGSDPAQVAAAKARFDEAKAKGYLPYRVDASGNRAEVINTFDPSAERVDMTPPMVGG